MLAAGDRMRTIKRRSQLMNRAGPGQMTDASTACVARQPIIDRAGRIVAYELLFRNGYRPVADVNDGFACTAHVIERAVGALGVDSALGGLDGYLNCTADFLHSGVPQILMGGRFVLEVLESCELDNALKVRCNALRAAGFRVALDDVATLSPEIEAFLPAVDIVKLEWPVIDAATGPTLVRNLKRAGKAVVAEKVDDREQWQNAMDWGCDMVQGFYFSKPQIMETRRLVPDLGQLLDLLNLLIDDACDHRIVRALSDMPVLVTQVLRLANCSGNANPRRTAIVSLHHALAVIGTTRLFQWCNLLLYNHADPGSVCRDPLIALATQRASLMLRLTAGAHPKQPAFAQSAYLTGMLSLLHVIYGREQEDFAEELPIGATMKAALTDRRGALGELLSAAEVFEGRQPMVSGTQQHGEHEQSQAPHHVSAQHDSRTAANLDATDNATMN
ncbi:EAL domain-containing protein (plasmid) [Paraburkholderia sp. PREW-6R]|uniref:EAL and HDOD domain-containing protein n=1 Tax=Paraburkholderia sp. PREW-6R TaxID=3141544 RepID=UPI0031F4D299